MPEYPIGTKIKEMLDQDPNADWRDLYSNIADDPAAASYIGRFKDVDQARNALETEINSYRTVTGVKPFELPPDAEYKSWSDKLDLDPNGWGRTGLDLLEGAASGLGKTIVGGGDLIRQGLGMERVINKPDVQNLMTSPDSGAGKVGQFGEQVAEFALGGTAKGLGTAARMGYAGLKGAGLSKLHSVGEQVDPSEANYRALASGTINAAIPGLGAAKKALGTNATDAAKVIALAATNHKGLATKETMNLLARLLGGNKAAEAIIQKEAEAVAKKTAEAAAKKAEKAAESALKLAEQKRREAVQATLRELGKYKPPKAPTPPPVPKQTPPPPVRWNPKPEAPVPRPQTPPPPVRWNPKPPATTPAPPKPPMVKPPPVQSTPVGARELIREKLAPVRIERSLERVPNRDKVTRNPFGQFQSKNPK